MGATKTYRHGQILRLVSRERIANQEDLRRRLAQQRLRVTQATLSRDLQELKLIKTTEGYKTGGAQPLAAAVDAAKFSEIAGTIAGDDTVLIITPSRKTRDSLQKKIEAHVK